MEEMASRKQRSSARSIGTSSIASEDSAFNNDTFDSSFHSRTHEKDKLTSLNSRLATYIERVRSLETENSRLSVQIKDIEVTETKEKEHLRSRFEVETNRLRDALNAKTSELTKAEIERSAAVAQLDDLRAQNARLARDLKNAEDAKLTAQALYEDTNAKFNKMKNQLAHLDTENADLSKKAEQLKKQLADTQRMLEGESLLRANLQQKLGELEEELRFTRETLSEEVEEVRKKREIDMTTVSKQLANDYEDKLQEQLEENRRQLGLQMQQNLRNLEECYKNKVNDNREEMEAARGEATKARIRVRELELESAELNKQLDELNKKITKLQSDLDSEKTLRRYQLEEKENRIRELNAEIDRMMKDGANLLALKVQLESELATYEFLLNGEETRLNLSNQHTPRSSSSRIHISESGRGTKRRRVSDHDSSYEQVEERIETFQTGNVSVAEVAFDGTRITLQNNSEEVDQPIGGWVIKNSSDGKEVSYKFNSKFVLKAGATVSIWSHNSGAQSKPPTDLVMKSQNWPSGPHPLVSVHDTDNEKVAWQELIKSTVHSNGHSSDPNDRCSIM